MENGKIRVACYGRYSTSMQREESISAQIRAMKKYCADNNWSIVKIYTDQAYSATTDKRPQFQQMISDSYNKEFDIVLVHKLDRFSRNRYDSSLYRHKLRKNGVRLCSVLERIDNSPESILLEGLLESINEFYSADLARESLKGMKGNAHLGLFNGGCPGLGYDVDETQHLVVNEEEAKAVIMIYSMYLSGYSYQKIADALNADGYKTKAGNAFNRNSFIEILRNEKYTGVYIFNRAEAKGYDHKRNNHRSKPAEEIIRIEGGIPAIISKETWLAAQEYRIKHNARNRCAKTMYLLSGMIKCGCCNKIMYGSMRIRKNHPSFYTYVCKTKKSKCCNLKEIDRDSLENYIVELILNKCLDDENSGERDKLMNTDSSSVVFRTLLQQYIKEITVHKDYVVFQLYVNGKVKSYRHKRMNFKTITQRYFK